jgi:predicted dehydrogenase
MRTISVGIIGLGHNGLAHGQAHCALGRSALVALCDRNPERLEAAGRALGVDALYTDPTAFFAHPGMEAVSINTGDAFHGAPFLAAVAAGKHVLIEKPLGNSEDEIAAMVQAAAAQPDLKIQVGYILRFNPVFARLHAHARAGDLGDLYYLEGDYIHNLLYQANQTDTLTGRNWYLEEEIPMVGGGCHALDLLRWISGKEVVRTWAYATHKAFPAMQHDDCQVALFQFADGSIAKVAALYAPRCGMAPYYNLRAYGTNGTVERDTVAISASADDVHPAFQPVDAERVAGHGYEPEILDWLDAIVDDRPPRCPLHDGANSTIAALCAVRAAREGREIAVPVFAAPQ